MAIRNKIDTALLKQLISISQAFISSDMMVWFNNNHIKVFGQGVIIDQLLPESLSEDVDIVLDQDTFTMLKKIKTKKVIIQYWDEGKSWIVSAGKTSAKLDTIDKQLLMTNINDYPVKKEMLLADMDIVKLCTIANAQDVSHDKLKSFNQQLLIAEYEGKSYGVQTDTKTLMVKELTNPLTKGFMLQIGIRPIAKAKSFLDIKSVGNCNNDKMYIECDNLTIYVPKPYNKYPPIKGIYSMVYNKIKMEGYKVNRLKMIEVLTDVMNLSKNDTNKVFIATKDNNHIIASSNNKAKGLFETIGDADMSGTFIANRLITALKAFNVDELEYGFDERVLLFTDNDTRILVIGMRH